MASIVRGARPAAVAASVKVLPAERWSSTLSRSLVASALGPDDRHLVPELGGHRRRAAAGASGTIVRRHGRGQLPNCVLTGGARRRHRGQGEGRIRDRSCRARLALSRSVPRSTSRGDSLRSALTSCLEAFARVDLGFGGRLRGLPSSEKTSLLDRCAVLGHDEAGGFGLVVASFWTSESLTASGLTRSAGTTARGRPACGTAGAYDRRP